MRRKRLRGSRTGGYGARQKHKGHGNQGGHGKAGSGKRADQKKLKLLLEAKEKGKKYFGSAGITSASSKRRKENKANLCDLSGKEVKFDGKVLGKGDGWEGKIYAKSASKQAIEKMEKAGGEIILPQDKIQKKK